MKEATKDISPEKKYRIRYGIHMLLTVLSAVGIAYFTNEVILEDGWEPRYFLCAGAILAVLALYLFLERKALYSSKRTMGLMIACFLVSALLLLLSDFYANQPIWLIGGIVMAALFNRNIGMIYIYYFVFHALYLQGDWREGIVIHFVTATVLAILIPRMKNFLSMCYLMVIVACMVVTGSIFYNRMCIDSAMMLDTFYILCTYLGCILITMLLVIWTERMAAEKPPEETEILNDYSYLELLASETATREAAEEQPEEAVEEQQEEAVEEQQEEAVEEQQEETVEEQPEEAVEEQQEEAVEEPEETVEEQQEEAVEEQQEEVTEEQPEEAVEEQPETVIDYLPYCDEKSELLLQLKEKNKAVYAQAILVGKLAAEIAWSIGVNAELTKAAGLYSKIGKIKDENDANTSAELAIDHDFPEALIDLLDQLGHNRMEQKEAALLLITEGAISYYSVVRHVQKLDIPVEKIVDTIISKKIFQGEFNQSGLTVQECFVLREKLVDILRAQDDKRVVK